MTNKPVFEIYGNSFRFSIEFRDNGYELTYVDHGNYTIKKRVYTKFEELLEFIKKYYSGVWV